MPAYQQFQIKSAISPTWSPRRLKKVSYHWKGAYTELFGIGPELTLICYINAVRYEKYEVI